MRQHIDKIKHYDIQIICLQICKFTDQTFSGGRIVYFIVREPYLAPKPFKLRGDKRRLVQILALLDRKSVV